MSGNFLPMLLVAAAALSAAGPGHAQSAVTPVTAWKPLRCPSGLAVESILSAPEVLPNKSQGAVGLLEIGRLTAFMRTAGVPTVVPDAAPHREALGKISRILQSGSFVGAKMALDEAVETIPGFKSTAFAADFEWFLRAMSQPVPHASYPTSVRADGEVWVKPASEAEDGHTHGFDLEQASGSLSEINRRLLIANRALKDVISERPVLDYLLGYGFNDPLAVRIATTRLCNLGRQKKWPAAQMQNIDVAARFMAMPNGSSGTPPIPTKKPESMASAVGAQGGTIPSNQVTR